jgi:WD40 repeat protein
MLLGSGSRAITSLAWSPDGGVLAGGTGSLTAGTGQDKRLVWLWDPDNGRLLRALESPSEAPAYSLGWSADGRTLRAWTAADVVSWDTSDGKLLGKVSCPKSNGPNYGLPISADARWLAFVQEDGRTAIWDAVKGEKARVLGTPRWDNLQAVAWSPDGKRLVFADLKGIYAWDIEADKQSFQYAQPGGGPATWSPDGRSLAYSLAHNQGTRVIEVAADAKPRGIGPGYALLAWSPDSKTVATVSSGFAGAAGWVRLYDAATGDLRKSLSEAGIFPPPSAWSVDGQTIAVCENGQTTLSSVDNVAVRTVIEDTKPPLALSPDGRRVVTGGPKHTLIVWESGGKVRIPLAGHEEDPTWVAWSSDGKRLASSSAGEKRVLLWDTDKGELLRELGPFPAAAVPVTWSPDGRLLAFHVSGVGWHFWDAEKTKLVNDPKQWQESELAFAPDSCSVLVSGNGFYHLRDAASGKKGGELPSTIPERAAAWSPDGRLLVLLTGSGLELWRGDLRRRVRTLEGPYSCTRDRWQLAFSADGKLVLGNEDGRRLHVWETDTGRLHGILFLGEQWNGLTITPEGHYNGNEKVDRGIVAVVQRDDGTQELLDPDDFEQKYGFKNEPDKVHLLQPLPPPEYPLPGMPMGPNALVREPAELADPSAASWTVETRSARGIVRAVAYRPDGKLLATGGDDGTVRIWDAATGQLVRMLVGGPVHTLSWSGDGRILAASALGHGTNLWEAETGRLLQRFVGESWSSCPPEGHTVAVANGRTCYLWDVNHGATVRSCAFENSINWLAWSADGKTIAFALQDKTVRLWDVASGEERQKLEAHQGDFIRAIAWSPDSKRLVTIAHGESGFRVWDAATGKLHGRFAVDHAPITVVWSPGGKAVAVGFDVGGPQGLFDPDDGRPLGALDPCYQLFAIAWSPDGKQMGTAGSEGVRLHGAATGKLLHTLEEGIHDDQQVLSLAWSPDGRRLALGFSYGRAPLRLVEAATGQKQPRPQDAFSLAAWSPDGRTLAAKGPQNDLRLWDAVTLRPLRTMDCPTSLGLGAMEWSPDGKMLAAGGEGHLFIWTADTGKVLFQEHEETSGAPLAWSPDGGRLAVGKVGGDSAHPKGAVYVWQSDNGKLMQVAPLPASRLAWSPDGRKLALSTFWAATVALIDSASGKLLGKGPEGIDTAALHWSPDGKTFVTFHRRLGTEGASVCIWDGERCTLLRSAPIPGMGGVSCAAWSPDGRVLACARDSQVHLHDAAGEPLGVLLPFDTLGQLAVTADGHYRGSARVEREIRMVVQKRDGTSETLTPAEFLQRYGFQNEPDKVRLTE